MVVYQDISARLMQITIHIYYRILEDCAPSWKTVCRWQACVLREPTECKAPSKAGETPRKRLFWFCFIFKWSLGDNQVSYSRENTSSVENVRLLCISLYSEQLKLKLDILVRVWYLMQKPNCNIYLLNSSFFFVQFFQCEKWTHAKPPTGAVRKKCKFAFSFFYIVAV